MSQHILIQGIIESKLQGEEAPADELTANLATCSLRAVRRHRSNLLQFGSTKAPSNGSGRPKSITPHMLTALCDQLSINSSMSFKDMAAFLRKDFDVEVTRFSIRRALKDIKWSTKCTQNVAQERNDNLRADYIYEVSLLRSDQLVFIDETGVDKSIGIRRRGWAPREKRARQVKRFHRGQRVQILPAYAQDGILHFQVYEGSTDAEIFEVFIETLLPYCGRWPDPKSVLIMDNASFVTCCAQAYI
jgi:transposase